MNEAALAPIGPSPSLAVHQMPAIAGLVLLL